MGDDLAILPKNASHLVEKLCDLLHIDPERCFTFVAQGTQSLPFPVPCSFRTAFTHYLDITSPPRFDVLRLLSASCDSDSTRDFINTLLSDSGQYEAWCLAARRGIVDVLEDLPSCQPKAEVLITLLPRLKPRHFSIASSPCVRQDRIQLAVAVVDYEAGGRTHNGVASTYLSALKPGDKAPVFVVGRTGMQQLRMPSSPVTPIIMVAAGTGIAPFRAFIQERRFIKGKGWFDFFIACLCWSI